MRAIELCGCAGGMAEGFRRAGIHFNLVVDWDADACASYESNLGHKPVQMDVRDIIRLLDAGWDPGPVDLLVADPPCTPWSIAGRRQGLKDDRDLLTDCVEIVNRLLPRAWLIANVPGLDHRPNAPAVERTIGSISRGGYCVHYSRLDAADYGVPQRRIRPFWYGHKLDTPCITWPLQTHTNPDSLLRQTVIPGVHHLRPWVTVREALSGLPVEQLGRVKTLRLGKTADHRPCRQDAPARTLTANNLGDGSLLELAPKHRPSHPDEPARTLTTSGQCDGALLHRPSSPDECGKAVTASEAGNGGMTVEWPWGPCPPARSGGKHQCVVLSEKARAILQGFPEDWVFVGATKRSRGAQIGMAMPPPLAEAVARSIAHCLGVGNA